MTLIDSLEYYYNRDDQGNLRTQCESEPIDEPFGELDEHELDERDEDEEDEEITEDTDEFGYPFLREDKDE